MLYHDANTFPVILDYVLTLQNVKLPKVNFPLLVVYKQVFPLKITAVHDLHTKSALH